MELQTSNKTDYGRFKEVGITQHLILTINNQRSTTNHVKTRPRNAAKRYIRAFQIGASRFEADKHRSCRVGEVFRYSTHVVMDNLARYALTAPSVHTNAKFRMGYNTVTP